MAINNRNPKSSTPTDLPFPLHKLTAAQNALWFVNPRPMAAALVKLYPGGVGVLSWSMHLFARVDPRGVIEPMRQPFRQFEKWQIANKAESDFCQCLGYYDPEVGGPWSLRGPEVGHHPLCEYDKTVKPVFKEAARRANENLAKGGPAQERPDEWLKIREEVQNR
jgi:hypothetical protein